MRTLQTAIVLFVLCMAHAAVASEPDKFAANGLNENAVKVFFHRLQVDVRDGDKQDLSEIVSYPLKVRGDKSTLTVHSKDEFVRRYHEIITPDVRSVVLCQGFDDLFVNYQGMMIGRGTLWFGDVSSSESEKSTLKIITINHDSYAKEFLRQCRAGQH